ncbi:helix-turn-helix domain-containing protein [Citrobacter farmeri]
MRKKRKHAQSGYRRGFAQKKHVLSSLGREHNLSPYTLKNALDKPYPKAEKIIAEAIGMTPEDIWPGRY